MQLDNIGVRGEVKPTTYNTGLEKSTRPLVFTSASGCRASENLDDFLGKLSFFPYMPIIFVMQGKCLFKDISRPVTPTAFATSR